MRLSIEHGSGEIRTYQNALLGKTATVNRQDTSENKTLIYQTPSLENTTHENLNKTQTLTKPTSKSLSFLPLLILVFAGIMALAAWYFQPFTETKTRPAFESVQVSRITENGKAGLAAISSDGKYVAFVNNENGLGSLTVRQIATGSNIQVVPPTNLGFLPPTFSTDGNYIFYTLIDKAVGTLYRIPSLGGTPNKIIVDVDSKVTFSPDGSRLEFIRHNPEKNIDTIVIADSDGTNPQPFITTEVANLKNFSEVAWSPDGEKILTATVDKLSSEKMISAKLVLISLSDKKVELFDNKIWLNANSFSWLKDGSGVFLLGKKSEEEQPQIWFLNYPEGESRQITSDSSGYAMMSYAKDSNTIAALKSDIITSLWSQNSQSKELKQITSESRDMLGANGIEQMPDGRLLVAKVERNQINLWIIDQSGRSEKQLTKDAGVNIQPVITPDGRFIIFASNRTGDFSLWRMDADGKNLVQLTNSQNEFMFDRRFYPTAKRLSSSAVLKIV